MKTGLVIVAIMFVVIGMAGLNPDQEGIWMSDLKPTLWTNIAFSFLFYVGLSIIIWSFYTDTKHEQNR